MPRGCFDDTKARSTLETLASEESVGNLGYLLGSNYLAAGSELCLGSGAIISNFIPGTNLPWPPIHSADSIPAPLNPRLPETSAM